MTIADYEAVRMPTLGCMVVQSQLLRHLIPERAIKRARGLDDHCFSSEQKGYWHE